MIHRQAQHQPDDAEANYWLSKAYLHGWIAADDAHRVAFQLLQRSADAGFSLAQVDLARSYMLGKAERRNPERALQLLGAAIDQQDPVAFTEWGIMLYTGQWGKRSLHDAERYLKLAVDKGYLPARANLALVYTAQDRNEEALKLLSKASAESDPRAQLLLGQWYRNGYAVPQDRKRALELVSGAANSGDIESIRLLAEFHANGVGTRVDQERAFGFYQRAAAAGDLQSRLEVAKRCLSGEGTPLDLERGVSLLVKLADEEYPPAQEALAIGYVEGLWVKRDLDAARRLFASAAAAGQSLSKRYLRWLDVAKEPNGDR